MASLVRIVKQTSKNAIERHVQFDNNTDCVKRYFDYNLNDSEALYISRSTIIHTRRVKNEIGT